MVLLFHNVFSSGDPIKDLIFFGGLLLLFITCNLAIFYGIYFLLRNWRDFDSRWKKVLMWVPLVIMLTVPASPIHPGWLSFPFADFALFPVLVFVANGNIFLYYIAGGFGVIFNIIGFIGITTYIQTRLERRRMHNLI